MASTAILAIRIISDATKAAQGFDQAEAKTSRLERGLGKADRAAKVAVAGLAAVGVAAFKEASALQQADGAVESVFGKSSDKVKALAKDAATSVGLAQSEYSQMAAVLGAQLGNLGVEQNKLVGTTDDLISVGADLAAAFGGSTADAVDALGAAMRGEADSVEKYGLSLNDARVMAELAKTGQDKLKGAALDQAKTQARLKLITEQTSKVQGQFARETDSAAGIQQVATAQLKDAGAAIGTILLPVMATLLTYLADFGGLLAENSGAVQVLAGVVGALAVAVIAANYAIKAYRTVVVVAKAVTKAWAAVQRVLNAVMRANPVGLVITAIAALVAIVVIAYKRSETFRRIVDTAMRAIRRAWEDTGRVAKRVWDGVTNGIRRVGDWLGRVRSWIVDRAGQAFNRARDIAQGALDAYLRPIQWVIDKVRDLIGWIRSIRWPSPPKWLRSVGGAIGSVIGGGSSGLTASHHGAPLVTAAGTSGGSLASSIPLQRPVQIIIQGALDPDAVARQVETILGRRGRRLGRV